MPFRREHVMSSFKGETTSGFPERGETVMSLATARRMLPLVQRIVADFLEQQKACDRLQPEQSRLERVRRSLTWPERQQRYRIQEELAQAEREMQGARQELEGLGVTLLDSAEGRVGFPTLVNNRRAFFSWQPGEEALHSWHFAEESVCRPIPQAWLKEISLSGKY